MFRVRAELEKGNQERLLPMTPDFAEFLSTTPEAERTGPVFSVVGMHVEYTRDPIWISSLISRIGKAAGIKVNTDTKTLKIEYASAHDLRRSFGARWAPRVMPAVLQLVRHQSIDTTLRHYVGQDADSLADAIWAASESTANDKVNTSVNTVNNPGGFEGNGQETE